MNELTSPNTPLTDADIADLIVSYEKGGDGGGVVLDFHNGYQLSVSWRPGTYGGLEGAARPNRQ